MMTATNDPLVSFLEAVAWRGSLDRAETILADHSEVSSLSVHAAAVLGDDAAVRTFLDLDPQNAAATAAPYGADALVYLCLSTYLRARPAFRSSRAVGPDVKP